MTPDDLAARVAALLDAGLPGHVRDLYEDLAAEMGPTEAAIEVRATLGDYRIACLFRHQAASEPNVHHARRLMEEMWAVIDPETA
jgi:hypothetical protein